MISNEVFVGYLHCRRKAFFKQAGQSGEVADIERVTLQLDMTYADGTHQIVSTDGSWTASYGPLLESDLLLKSGRLTNAAIKD